MSHLILFFYNLLHHIKYLCLYNQYQPHSSKILACLVATCEKIGALPSIKLIKVLLHSGSTKTLINWSLLPCVPNAPPLSFQMLGRGQHQVRYFHSTNYLFQSSTATLVQIHRWSVNSSECVYMIQHLGLTLLISLDSLSIILKMSYNGCIMEFH